MNHLKFAMVVAACCVTTASLAAKGDAPAGKPVILKPQTAHEKCMSMEPPQKLHYSFGSDKPLDFNVHYHKGDMVYSPVKEKKITSFEGVFSPQVREDYCMMWENKSPSEEVKLEYTFKVKR